MASHLTMQEHRVMHAWHLACPTCGSDDDVQISVTVFARLHVEGTEIVDGDHEWDDDSAAMCGQCRQTGLVADFRTDQEDTP